MFYDVSDLKTKEIFLRLVRTSEAQPEKQWVPAYYFDICLVDGTKVGYCDLRIGHNGKTFIGGNIGYGIDEPYRGHLYAAKACKLLFKQARKHGMDHLTISCVPTNKASARTCEHAGGKYIGTFDIPEDNEMYAEGKRQVMIYSFDLKEEAADVSAEKKGIPAKEEKDHYFRVISNQVRFGCGYRTVDGKRQYFAWHGYPNRNDDFFTTAEISAYEFDEIQRRYPGEIVADRETAEVFRNKYVDRHPVILEGWNKLL